MTISKSRVIVLAMVSVLVSCTLPTDEDEQAIVDCPSGTYQDPNGSATCLPNPLAQPDLTITIGPQGSGHMTTIGGQPTQVPHCFAFTPNPGSVRATRPFVFKNATSETLTITGADRTPWATLAPGATSGRLNLGYAAILKYGIQNCTPISTNESSRYYGSINVTVN